MRNLSQYRRSSSQCNHLDNPLKYIIMKSQYRRSSSQCNLKKDLLEKDALSQYRRSSSQCNQKINFH